MYLKWHLPSGSAGMAAGITKHSILKQLGRLAAQHGFTYTTSHIGYDLYCELSDPHAYTIVSLGWRTTVSYQKITLVDTGQAMPTNNNNNKK